MQKRILLLSNMKILKKLGFSPEEKEDPAISNIVLFILFCVLVAGFIGYKLGTTPEAPKGLEFVLSIAAAMLSFDVIKEIVESTIRAVSGEKFEHGKIEGLKEAEKRIREIRDKHDSDLEKIHMNSEEAIQEHKHRYYLSRIGNESIGFSISELKLDALDQGLCKEVNRLGIDSFTREFEKKSEEIRESRAVRCLIQGLSDEEFIRPMALMAARYVLNKTEEEMNERPEYNLFKDIYRYLKGWLVCSIDNDTGDLMPISVIGLNYPNSKSPDKDTYKLAFSYIRDELLERNLSRKILKEKATKVVRNYLDELLKLIEEYPDSD